VSERSGLGEPKGTLHCNLATILATPRQCHYTKESQKVMKTNRSMPSSAVIPVLAYANVREAVDWLCRAFGLVERLRIGDHRAELSFGGGAMVIPGQQEPLPQGGFSHSVMAAICGRSRRRSQMWTRPFGAAHSLSSYSPYLRRSWSAATERA
jgi:hypothetical protein